MNKHNRWTFEKEDYIIVDHKQITQDDKKNASELLKRIGCGDDY